MRSIRCNGPICKGKSKLVIFFAPAELKSDHSICRACRKEYQKRYAPSTRGERGWRWRQESSKLLPGSIAGSAQLYQANLKRKGLQGRRGGIAA
jgi:hypothetical protein